MKVKVQAKESRKAGKAYKTLYVAIPSTLAELIGVKEGDELNVTIRTVDIDGKQVQALVYYKEAPKRE